MWNCKPNKPFPPQVAVVMVFHHSTSNSNYDTILLSSTHKIYDWQVSFQSLDHQKACVNTHITLGEPSRILCIFASPNCPACLLLLLPSLMLFIIRPSWNVKYTTCTIPNSYQSDPVTFMTYISISKNIIQRTCLKALLHGIENLWLIKISVSHHNVYWNLKVSGKSKYPNTAICSNSKLCHHRTLSLLKVSWHFENTSMLQKIIWDITAFGDGVVFFFIQLLPILFNAFSSLRSMYIYVFPKTDWKFFGKFCCYFGY